MLNDYRYHAGQLKASLTEIKFSGSDVKSFLQTQSTFNVDKFEGNSFQLVSFLDPQGRLETYGWLVHGNGQYTFFIPSSLEERTLVRLNKFLISEDVEIHAPEKKEVYFILGPEGESSEEESYAGILFDEKALLQRQVNPSISLISDEDVELWRALTGWPSFDGKETAPELFNNLRLFDLSLSNNKGCYPGQETVSKIATRRGAAFSPVLIKTASSLPPGDIYSFDKKIGTSTGTYEWDGHYYLTASLLRDFRVEKMKFTFAIDSVEAEGFVKYYPLLSGDNAEKARELYDAASEDFKKDDLKGAEEKFRLAIKLDPSFADAFESLGVMLGRMERYQEAIELMKKLSEIDPKSVLAHTNMSLFLMKTGKIEDAEEQKSLATVKSFQSFGDEAKNKEIENARKLKQQEEWAQRESMFRQVLEIDPDDTLANYGIGSIAVEKGEWSIAREHLERVLKQDPKYSVAYLALGRALKGLGLINEAKEVWQEGIKVSAAKGDLMPANQMQQELSF